MTQCVAIIRAEGSSRARASVRAWTRKRYRRNSLRSTPAAFGRASRGAWTCRERSPTDAERTRRCARELVFVIGTLNEGSLHAQLKAWYAAPGDTLERPVDGYVVDLVRGSLLVEIQTSSFAPLRRKLDRLLEAHDVRVVVPVALTRRIVRLSRDGEVLSGRRSPGRGRAEDVFARLVSLPGLLAHPRFQLELLLTHEEEHRRHEPGRAFRRHGWVIIGRSLVSVEERILLSRPADAVALLPPLPELFDTDDLANAAGCTRRLAQQMTYCLRSVGVLAVEGKRGRALLYRRSDSSLA